jgi:hypothetical protein
MRVEINQEYISVFKRQLSQQLYQEFCSEYAFPRAVSRSLSELFVGYIDLYFGTRRREGQIIFHGIRRDVPPGVKVEEMHLKPVLLTLYDPQDCCCRDQKSLLKRRIVRISGEGFTGGILLTQADISMLLGQSPRTIMRYIRELEAEGETVPTRGKWKDIGPGTSHKKRIVELYVRGDEYTDIGRKTKHSSEAIMRYIKDFARVLILHEQGYSREEIRVVSDLSDKVLREYLELIEAYQGEEYEERLDQLRGIYRKKTFRPGKEGKARSDSCGRSGG